jgi:outer membrane lipoprotein carrier protein
LAPAVLFLAASAAAPTADPTLAKARALYGRAHDLTCVFEQESLWQGIDETVRSRGTLSLRFPERVRLEYDDPDGDLLVADGHLMWTYVRSLKQAVRTELDSTGYHVGRLLLAFLESSAGVTRLGEEKVGGKAAVSYSIRWVENPFRLVDLRLWMTREDGRIVRFEFEDEQGNHTRYVFSKIRFDGGVPDEQFLFTPPPGTDVVSYSAGGAGRGTE